VKSIWREYGLIAILIVISVTGYFAFNEHKEELLAFSLETVGSHLVDMVDDPVARERLAVAFTAFRDRVANQEVAPEEVELVTASLLNLTTSGERLGVEDVDMVVDLWEPAVTDVPRPKVTSAVEWDRTAARVNKAVLLAREAMLAMPSDSLRRHTMHFSTSESGAIRLSVDSDATVFLRGTDTSELPMLVRVDSTLSKRHLRLSEWIAARKAGLDVNRDMDSLTRVIELGIFADIDTMRLRLETENLVPRTLVAPKTSVVDNQ